MATVWRMILRSRRQLWRSTYSRSYLIHSWKSKPGRRVYVSVKALPRVNNGLGVAILSTPKGVMADHDARDQNVGGEILCTVV